MKTTPPKPRTFLPLRHQSPPRGGGGGALPPDHPYHLVLVFGGLALFVAFGPHSPWAVARSRSQVRGIGGGVRGPDTGMLLFHDPLLVTPPRCLGRGGDGAGMGTGCAWLTEGGGTPPSRPRAAGAMGGNDHRRSGRRGPGLSLKPRSSPEPGASRRPTGNPPPPCVFPPASSTTNFSMVRFPPSRVSSTNHVDPGGLRPIGGVPIQADPGRVTRNSPAPAPTASLVLGPHSVKSIRPVKPRPLRPMVTYFRRNIDQVGGFRGSGQTTPCLGAVKSGPGPGPRRARSLAHPPPGGVARRLGVPLLRLPRPAPPGARLARGQGTQEPAPQLSHRPTPTFVLFFFTSLRGFRPNDADSNRSYPLSISHPYRFSGCSFGSWGVCPYSDPT